MGQAAWQGERVCLLSTRADDGLEAAVGVITMPTSNYKPGRIGQKYYNFSSIQKRKTIVHIYYEGGVLIFGTL
jgi:hypothetical protein